VNEGKAGLISPHLRLGKQHQNKFLIGDLAGGQIFLSLLSTTSAGGQNESADQSTGQRDLGV
jgi:hypothetical protein